MITKTQLDDKLKRLNIKCELEFDIESIFNVDKESNINKIILMSNVNYKLRFNVKDRSTIFVILLYSNSNPSESNIEYYIEEAQIDTSEIKYQLYCRSVINKRPSCTAYYAYKEMMHSLNYLPKYQQLGNINELTELINNIVDLVTIDIDNVDDVDKIIEPIEQEKSYKIVLHYTTGLKAILFIVRYSKDVTHLIFTDQLELNMDEFAVIIAVKSPTVIYGELWEIWNRTVNMIIDKYKVEYKKSIESN